MNMMFIVMNLNLKLILNILVLTYGHSHSNQISTQTLEDKEEICIQTEEISMQDVWIQATQDHFIDSGSGQAMFFTKDQEKRVLRDTKDSRLNTFLFQMTEFLENEMDEEQDQQVELDSPLGFLSTKSFVLDSNTKRLSRKLIQVHCESNRIFCLESNNDTSSPIQGIITVWNTFSNTIPERILFGLSRLQNITTCPTMPDILIAGTGHGSIQVWDLTESNPDDFIEFQTKSIGVWYPSYCTDGLFVEINDHSHSNPIVSLQPLDQQIKQVQVYSCQFASIDESGLLIVWTLLRLNKEYEHRYDLDYGMKLNSRIKISKSFTNALHYRLIFRFFVNLKFE